MQACMPIQPPESLPLPNTRAANAVRLEFAPASLVHANLSGAAFSGCAGSTL